MKTSENLREMIAKLGFQFAYLIEDKRIDELWQKTGQKGKWLDCADQTLAEIKEAGWVKLAENQESPTPSWTSPTDAAPSVEDIISKAYGEAYKDFRRVEL